MRTRHVRRIYIGDIQGCRSELERLLEVLRFDTAADRLEPVGDLVNRGPDSLGTLRLLRDLDAGGVLGNHDTHLLRVAAGLREPSGRDTLDEVLAAEDRDALLEWLAQKPFARADPGVLLVHAGIHPLWKDPVARLAGRDPLTPHPDSDFATLVRYCAADGRRPKRGQRPRRGFRPWFEHWKDAGSRTAVFGHWAERGLVHEPGLRGLDTGCVWGGQLTAWIAEEDRFASVPAERAWARIR
jgi:bis(5'-nucleosyl)-tetraphosphatase (symmetrical)